MPELTFTPIPRRANWYRIKFRKHHTLEVLNKIAKKVKKEQDIDLG